jgi:Na+/H+ antiporter NhaA
VLVLKSGVHATLAGAVLLVAATLLSIAAPGTRSSPHAC